MMRHAQNTKRNHINLSLKFVNFLLHGCNESCNFAKEHTFQFADRLVFACFKEYG